MSRCQCEIYEVCPECTSPVRLKRIHAAVQRMKRKPKEKSKPQRRRRVDELEAQVVALREALREWKVQIAFINWPGGGPNLAKVIRLSEQAEAGSAPVIEKYKTLLNAAAILDRLDWCIGYELGAENAKILDEALTLVRGGLRQVLPAEKES